MPWFLCSEGHCAWKTAEGRWIFNTFYHDSAMVEPTDRKTTFSLFHCRSSIKNTHILCDKLSIWCPDTWQIHAHLICLGTKQSTLVWACLQIGDRQRSGGPVVVQLKNSGDSFISSNIVEMSKFRSPALGLVISAMSLSMGRLKLHLPMAQTKSPASRRIEWHLR